MNMTANLTKKLSDRDIKRLKSGEPEFSIEATKWQISFIPSFAVNLVVG